MIQSRRGKGNCMKVIMMCFISSAFFWKARAGEIGFFKAALHVFWQMFVI